MTISTIEKFNKIMDGLIKHSSEDPCEHTFAQILNSIFDNDNKRPDTTPQSFVSDAIPTPSPKGNEIV